ncbi:uncharacterized protein LOC111373784 [Olea europaea var. sylvestris]|uniref:uncharacterized protein LOC111373784 n=1 Tax=Olea europaea var. sylvestris TaxID=158386 RepID=UPI000C1D2373|nr:uncharacterized protein LOC111373784 [Olea europaea var. sylvestris]
MGGEWRSRRGAVRDGCNDMVMAQIEAAVILCFCGSCGIFVGNVLDLVMATLLVVVTIWLLCDQSLVVDWVRQWSIWARIPILTSHFPPFLQIDLHLSITTQTNSVVKSGQEEYGRRTRPRRNVQRRNIAPTQAVAYCYWQGPMCRHVVLDFVQGKERWSCSIGLEASLGWPRRSSLGFRWIAENEI